MKPYRLLSSMMMCIVISSIAAFAAEQLTEEVLKELFEKNRLSMNIPELKNNLYEMRMRFPDSSFLPEMEYKTAEKLCEMDSKSSREEGLSLLEKFLPGNVYGSSQYAIKGGIQYGDELDRRKRYSEASEVFRALAESDNMEAVFHAVARLYVRCGVYGDAAEMNYCKEALKNAINFIPDDGSLHYATFLEKVNTLLMKIDGLSQENPDVMDQFQIGYYYRQVAEWCEDNGMKDKAMENWQKSLDVLSVYLTRIPADPDHEGKKNMCRAHFNLGLAAFKFGDHSECLEHMEIFIQKWPEVIAGGGAPNLPRKNVRMTSAKQYVALCKHKLNYDQESIKSGLIEMMTGEKCADKDIVFGFQMLAQLEEDNPDPSVKYLLLKDLVDGIKSCDTTFAKNRLAVLEDEYPNLKTDLVGQHSYAFEEMAGMGYINQISPEEWKFVVQ